MIRSLRCVVALPLITIALTLGCSAQTEEQALAGLRALSASGKLPSESVVADIERRFANGKTGALARLLRARIRLEQGDGAGAAALLDSDIFARRTKIAEYALWLRGKALADAAKHGEALEVLNRFLAEYPDSVRRREARLLWASSATAAGRAVEVPPMLVELSEARDADALLLTARAFEAQGSRPEAEKYFRRTYFYAGGSTAAAEAETWLSAAGVLLSPQNADEISARADALLNSRKFNEAAAEYALLATAFPTALTAEVQLRRINALAGGGKATEAQALLGSFPASSPKLREEAYRQVVLALGKTRQWPQMRTVAEAMRAAFAQGASVPRTLIDAAIAARDAKNRVEEAYYIGIALNGYPNAVEVAQAQFESGWLRHEQGNYSESSRMFIEHLARYAAKDTTNRGKAGYWAARDSERAGRTADACLLYDAVVYRYGANWYGYLAAGRLDTLRGRGECRQTGAASGSEIAAAIASLRSVTVAPETAGENERALVLKSDELSLIGLFDWAIDELNAAKRTAGNSPSINMALARHYRWKGDNVAAFLALRASYPDYAQMFPEEMGREEWAIFYPLTHWDEIRRWAAERRLDPYQVAGLIRQESVFMPSAKSAANAYGMMQLLVPTAQTMARKYVAKTAQITPATLYQAPLNIELGTAYMREQLDKYGRIEYVAVAYNAGPGRVPQWRATLPAEIDEFVEAIPFKETKGYVQGVIRNTAQYRRLYLDNGTFRPNVGARPLRSEIDSRPREELLAQFPDLRVDTADANDN